MSVGERLVKVLVTVLVPDAADPEDAAALIADAADVQRVGGGAHRRGGGAPAGTGQRRHDAEEGQPAAVVTLGEGTALLRRLDGNLQTSPLPALAPDLLETAGARRSLLGRDAP